jgi:DNA-binding NarL/FixJ family response regulator
MAESKRPPLRVMLVDDHEVVRDGIRAMLAPEDDIHVTAEAGTVREAIDEADRARPDVVVMDVRLADLPQPSVVLARRPGARRDSGELVQADSPRDVDPARNLA